MSEDYNVNKYNQSTPIPAKFLMPDGSVSDTLPGGGGGGGSTSWNQVYSKPFNTISTNDFKVESNQLKLKNPGGSVMDNALSTTSENGVQNKVITSALNRKQNVLTAGTGISIDNTNPDNPEISANVDYTNLINKPTKLSDFTNDQNFVDNTVNNLTNYYLKTQTYTQEEVNNLISHLASLTVEIVETLPTQDISTSTIYLINVTGTTNYEQWMYINSAWSNIGNTSVDLSNYYTKSQADTLLNDKVDKVSGKGLSTNDFNDTYKDMLDNYEVDSELNSASTNPIQNGAVADALNLKQPKTLSAPIVVGGESSSTVETALGNINNLVNTKLPMVTSLPSNPSNRDTVLYTGSGSGGLVTGGIYQYQVSEWVLISSAGGDVYTKTETDTLLNGKQDTLPTVVNDKYLHTNSTTGALEWSDLTNTFKKIYTFGEVADSFTLQTNHVYLLIGNCHPTPLAESPELNGIGLIVTFYGVIMHKTNLSGTIMDNFTISELTLSKGVTTNFRGILYDISDLY